MVQFRGEAVTRPSISVVPEGHLGYTADVPKYPYDVAKAKALLAEAGFPNGVTIKAIHTTLPGMLATIEATPAPLQEAGTKPDLTPVEQAHLHNPIPHALNTVAHHPAN